MQFVGKFQQLTGPVTAKGIEDTAFYIYHRLVSLNEVGGEPGCFGIAPRTLHAAAERAAPVAARLSATSTHDTKRGEDVRARINVLRRAARASGSRRPHWARPNRRARTMIDGESLSEPQRGVPVYQTLVGSWPLEPLTAVTSTSTRGARRRIHAARRCAKRRCSPAGSIQARPTRTRWRGSSSRCSPLTTRRFSTASCRFAARSRASASTTRWRSVALKIGAPGVPDFYQGTRGCGTCQPGRSRQPSSGRLWPPPVAARRWTAQSRLAETGPSPRADGTPADDRHEALHDERRCCGCGQGGRDLFDCAAVTRRLRSPGAPGATTSSRSPAISTGARPCRGRRAAAGLDGVADVNTTPLGEPGVGRHHADVSTPAAGPGPERADRFLRTSSARRQPRYVGTTDLFGTGTITLLESR